MPLCVAFGCNNREGHLFPRDKDLKAKWVAAIKRTNFCPSKRAVVCSQHFLTTDYETTSFDSGHKLQNRRLKKGAVPSVFSWKKKLNLRVAEGRAARVQKRHLSSVGRSVVKKRRLSDMEAPEIDNAQPEIEILPHEELFEDQTDSLVEEMVPDMCCEVEIQSEVDSVVTEVDSTVTTIQGKGKAKATKPNNQKMKSVGCQTKFKTAFSHEKMKDNPECVHYYTGLESYDKFMLVFHSLGPAAFELNYRYSVVENICIEDQFLMTLIKLRRAEPDIGLVMLFDVSKKTVQNVVITWLNFLYHEWLDLDLWPSKDLVHFYMPDGFKKLYPSTRVIIDGTEIPIAAPSKPLKEQAAFSTYKNRTTMKVLIGATPGGLISYVSPAYGGSTSDRAVVERSDLFTKCEPHDSIMADRGFTVQDLFAPYHVTVNMPAFMKGKSQLLGLTLLKDRKLASKRVHIERIIGLAKTYTILKNELPVYYVPLASEILYVCCVLCNFRENIVSKNA